MSAVKNPSLLSRAVNEGLCRTQWACPVFLNGLGHFMCFFLHSSLQLRDTEKTQLRVELEVGQLRVHSNLH